MTPLARLVLRGPPIPVAIGTRHVRLCAPHVEALFGPGHALRPLVPLSLPGEYACLETVTVRGPSGRVEDVRVVGPLLERTRVELPATVQAALQLSSCVRDSARVDGSPGCTLEGPRGTVVLAEGVVHAPRQLFVPSAIVAELGVIDDEKVSVSVSGERARVLADVRVRVLEGASLQLRVDVDDGNALELTPSTVAYLVDEPPSLER